MDISRREEVTHRLRIGERIAEIRKAKGLSQNKLARLTGIDSSTIGRIELGKINAGIESICKIAEVLDSRLDFVPV